MRADFKLKWILLGALALTAVDAGSASAVAPATVKIAIGAMTFSAPKSSVKVGDTIEWVNGDIVDHTATEKVSGVWNVSMAPGKSARVVMKKAGTFDYYCRYHPNMVARLVVTAGKKK
jgi:plastocyanin